MGLVYIVSIKERSSVPTCWAQSLTRCGAAWRPCGLRLSNVSFTSSILKGGMGGPAGRMWDFCAVGSELNFQRCWLYHLSLLCHHSHPFRFEHQLLAKATKRVSSNKAE